MDYRKFREYSLNLDELLVSRLTYPTLLSRLFSKALLFALFFSLLLTIQAQEQTDPTYHRVVLEENLFCISLKYNVRLECLREWNNLSSDDIQVDQRLIVGYEETQATEQNPPADKPELPLQPLAEYDQMLASIVDQVEALYYETLALESKKGQRKDTALINAIFRRKYSHRHQVTSIDLNKSHL